MSRYYLRNTPCQDIPDHDPAIVAAHSQQGPVFIKRTGQSQRNAIQRSVKLLRVILSKRFYNEALVSWLALFIH